MQFGLDRPELYHVQTVNDRLAVIVNRKRRQINVSTSNLKLSGTDAAQPT